MGTLTKPFTYSSGGFAVASQVNSDFDTIYNWINGGSGMWADGSVAFTGIPALPAADPSTDNQATRKHYVDYITRMPVSVAARPGVTTRVDYVVVGTDQQAYHTFGNLGGALAAWEPLGGVLRGVNSAWTGDGNWLVVVGYGTTQSIYVNYTHFDGTPTWTGWFVIPGQVPAR